MKKAVEECGKQHGMAESMAASMMSAVARRKLCHTLAATPGNHTSSERGGVSCEAKAMPPMALRSEGKNETE